MSDNLNDFEGFVIGKNDDDDILNILHYEIELGWDDRHYEDKKGKHVSWKVSY